MNLEAFIDQTKTAVRRSLAKQGNTEPTPEEVAEHGRRLASLIDAQDLIEINKLSDWAEMLMYGCPGISSIEEWASEQYSLAVDACEDEIDSFDDSLATALNDILTRLDTI